MLRRLYIFILAVFVLSCDRMEQIERVDEALVDVSLSISVDCCDIITKAEGDAPQDDETSIKNLWIIQYDGVDDSAELLGEPVHIPDFSDFNKTVKLVAREKECMLVFLANTFEDFVSKPIPQGSTLGQLKQRYKEVRGPDDMLGSDSEGKKYPIFSDCVIVDKVLQEVAISAELKRNLAKVSITVKTVADVSISSLQLCSVSDKSFYVTNYDGLQAPFPSVEIHSTIDYEPVEWPAEQTEMSLSTYLPVNMRGTVSENVAPAYKNRYAPEGSTYLLVSGTYKEDGQDIPVSYKFYLGKNMVDNFNIEPNHAYSYTFTIDKKGDADNDSRVEDMGLVDFTSPRYELANSYILNPPATGTRRFRIPIQRIFTFWGDELYDYYEDDETLALKNHDGKWRAFVLQSDFNLHDSNFKITKPTGVAGTDTYFEVEVGPGVKGNIVIGVGPDDGNENEKLVSWSWHLWITDYDPYDALDWGDGRDGKYIYPVTGGSVHRYEGTYWNNNKDCYIMDRNLGWTSEDANTYPEDNKGLLYYQFGRKDPFFFDFKTKSAAAEYSAANGSEYNGVAYSVRNPLKFIKSPTNEDWTKDNKYNPSPYDKNIIWNDPATLPGEHREGQKSIFDPCPPGYRLPDGTIWSDFRNHKDVRLTTNAFTDSDSQIQDSDYKVNFKPYQSIKGLQYWPFQGEGINIPDMDDKMIYIPATGYIYAKDASIVHDASESDMWSFLWSEDPGSEINGSGYTSQNNHLSTNFVKERSRAFPVRCITDK